MSVFGTEPIECFLPYGVTVGHLELESGMQDATLFLQGSYLTSECGLVVCEQEYCDVYPDDALCFTGNPLFLPTSGWPGGNNASSLPQPINQASTDSEYGCLQFCASHPVAVHSYHFDFDHVGSDYNCLCYDESVTCYIPWGSGGVFEPPSGRIFSKSVLDQCDAERNWCDLFPDHQLCYHGNQYNIRDQGWPWSPTTNDQMQPANQLNASNAKNCVAFCLPDNQLAVYLWSDVENEFESNCLCYDDEDAICVVPWDHSIETSAIPDGIVYAKEEVASLVNCSGVAWCDLVPDHWLCFTKNSYEVNLDGWPWDPQWENALEEANSVNASSLMTCIKHCDSNRAAVYLSWRGDFSNDNCHCYDEKPTCLVPWGSQVGWGARPFGVIISFGTPLNPCTDYDWCDVQPDHWLCVTGTSRSVETIGWPWQPDVTDNSQVTDNANVSSIRSCIQHCMSFHLAVYLTRPNEFVSENCLCYVEGATCLVPWGRVDSNLRPAGEILTLTGGGVETCSGFTWCDILPEHWSCMASIEWIAWPWDISGQKRVEAADKLDAPSQAMCLQYCHDYPVTLYLDSGWDRLVEEDVNCLCFDNHATCLVVRDWDDLSGHMFAKQESPILSCDKGACAINSCGVEWCDVFPHDELCG